MNSFGYRYDLRPVFDDFLIITMCAVTQNPLTGKSHYEDLYMETIAKYVKDDLRHQFPKLFGALVMEMEDRRESGMGNDVLGDYYEQNFCRKNSGQFFTPWPICQLMAHCTCGEAKADGKQRILDPTCGSGRMLVSSAKILGTKHEYYGIDIDHTCVKMAALNLFLNGIFHAEIMCADALSPDDFRTSYALSLLPFGIFRIEDKERSRLWHMHRNSFPKKQPAEGPKLILPSEEGMQGHSGSQLHLF